ncbi:pirin family protein [Hymenobacter rubripertinctus]|uniref:Pirin family protein n=1 Tax=Hymenobacter rubripertinctus TaxID=2029981 RepID=A0A418R1U1_9BACT|nr:pirin family protein [Hymenobacter rubripertinctus]RIY11385.1 pirin family protein [Hymenobacter rubripertinctus]
MQTVLHTADSRGHANHGWLNSHHSFSFAGYHNPARMHFGALRVLNDDTVAGGMGFGTHPHDNMEIISIPLSGTLEHQDNAGNHGLIRSGDVQMMSAGTGIAHSEKNHSSSEQVKFLQIWIIPNKRSVTPRYDQQSFRAEDRHNQFQQVLSPSPTDAGVWIQQDAWFHLADFDAGHAAQYELKKAGNGVFVFVLEGQATVAGQPLDRRDGLGIWETDQFTVQATAATRLLLMEVPMQF